MSYQQQGLFDGDVPVSAEWVADIAYFLKPPSFWYLRVYQNGHTVHESWSPAPANKSIIPLPFSVVSTITGSKNLAVRGSTYLSGRYRQAFLSAVAENKYFDLSKPPSKKLLKRASRVKEYLIAECSMAYKPPPLPDLDEHTLIDAAFRTLDLEDEATILYQSGALAPSDLHYFAFVYVYEHLLKGSATSLAFIADPFSLLALRRRQFEHIAATYPFLAKIAAETFYDNWVDTMGDLPWPLALKESEISWKLNCK